MSCQNIVDTEPFAHKLDLHMGNLQGLAAIFLGKRMPKSLSTSNWDCHYLKGESLGLRSLFLQVFITISTRETVSPA